MIIKFLISIIYLLLTQQNAFAYLGLGPLIPLIGSGIAYFFVLLVTIFGFIIFPLRKLISYLKNKKSKNKKT